jgi:serine/threonine protein kinase
MKFAVRDLTGRIGDTAVDTSRPYGRGATAVVYPAIFRGEPCAAKIYHQDRNVDTAKVKAMLGNTPANVRIQIAGDGHPQFAWPFALLNDRSGRDVGYLMPHVDLVKAFSLDYFYDQTLIKKLRSPSEAALSFKLEIARNLTLLVADLHDHGHYFIDLKPQNIRVFLGSHVVTLVDCDGFSVAGPDGTRYSAEMVSSDYIAPEAYRAHTLPAQLGEAQDRYALAVILFQLLNRGTHPFQGIVGSTNITASTNDEKAAKGLYPHGMKPDALIVPRPQSIHFLFDDRLRAMFDAAFSGPEANRPSAREWADCLDKILRSKGLAKCDREPHDLTHMRFAGRQCPTCYLAGLKPVALPMSNSQVDPAALMPRLPPSTSRQYPPIQPPRNLGTYFPWGWAAIVALVVVLFASTRSPETVSGPASVPSTASTSPAAPSGPACAAAAVGRENTERLCEMYWQSSLPSCDGTILLELRRRGITPGKGLCTMTPKPSVAADPQPPINTATPTPVTRYPLLALHSVDSDQTVSYAGAEKSNPSLWVAANEVVVAAMRGSIREVRESEAAVFFPNVSIRPFRGLQLSFGTPQCTNGEKRELAGVCDQRENGLQCDKDMLDQLGTRLLCIESFVK